MRPADSIGWSETISAQRHRRAESRMSSLLGRIPPTSGVQAPRVAGVWRAHGNPGANSRSR
jgi:hypothetical protein